MTENICITTTSAEKTLNCGRVLGKLIDRPLFIALTGDLGSGKTVLIQGLAQGLGIPPEHPVTSPTYTLVNEYDGRLPLFHVDLYRLSGPDDTIDLGLADIISGGGVTAIEWSERLDGGDFSPDIAIDIAATGETDRRISIFFYGTGIENLVEGMKHFLQQ